jgi:hypothetical protein
MVRSERTTVGFFHQLVGERPQSLQERLALGRVEARERVPQRLVAAVEPCFHVLLAERVQVDDRAPLVLDRLAAVHEAPLLEVASEAARGGQGDAELVRQLADGPRALGPDLDQERDVAAPDPRLPVQERLEVGGRPPAPPEAAEHLAEEPAELDHLWIGSPHDFEV